MRMINRAFEEYGEDIKEFQWLSYKYDVTGQTEFPYEKCLDPFIQMGWLVRTGDTVSLEKNGEILLDKAYQVVERPRPKPKKRTTNKNDEVLSYLLEVFQPPVDIEINYKYNYQLSSLLEKFGGSLVISVAEWYNENRDELPREYTNLRYEQFMHHGMFSAIRKWMTEGVSKTVDFRNRVG